MPLDTYPFTDIVTLQVCLAVSSNPRFYAALGHAIDPEKMANKAAGSIVQAARTLSKAAPVTTPSAVLQHIRAQVQAGKVTFALLQEASDLLDTAEDAGGVPELDGFIALVKPILKHSAHKDAVEEVIQEYGKGGSVESAAEKLSKIAQIGLAVHDLGSAGEGDSADILAAADSTLKDPLATGMMEVDHMLEGGLERYALGAVMADSGDGKSMFLSHVASEAIFHGIDVAYVTLELSIPAIKQRIYCNLLNMTPRELLQDSGEAVRRYELLQKRKTGLGGWRAVYMSPQVTTPQNIRTWLREVAKEYNFKPQLLVVDYADKMAGTVGTKKHAYEDQRDVWEGLRSIATNKEVDWLWTASQTTGRQGRKKLKRGGEDIADSMNKFRVADLFLSIVRTEEDCSAGMVRFQLPKRRNAAAHGEVGPLPMDAEHWRMVTVSRVEPW